MIVYRTHIPALLLTAFLSTPSVVSARRLPLLRARPQHPRAPNGSRSARSGTVDDLHVVSAREAERSNQRALIMVHGTNRNADHYFAVGNGGGVPCRRAARTPS